MYMKMNRDLLNMLKFILIVVMRIYEDSEKS